MYILDDLFYGNITPAERNFSNKSEYAQALDQCVKTSNVFSETLSKEQETMYLELEREQSNMLAISECSTFINGARFGAQVILDLLGKENPPLF